MIVKPGDTNVTTYFALRLTADGTAATGLTITAIDLQYVRSGVAPSAKVDATALAATDSVHADNQAIEIDATDQPGLYRVDWPDAAFATGVREVILTVKEATVFTEHLRVELEQVADAVLDEPMTETTGAPAVTGTFRDALKWMFALSRNKITQTSTTTTLRDDADGSDLATSTVSDNGTTYTRGEWST